MKKFRARERVVSFFWVGADCCRVEKGVGKRPWHFWNLCEQDPWWPKFGFGDLEYETRALGWVYTDVETEADPDSNKKQRIVPSWSADPVVTPEQSGQTQWVSCHGTFGIGRDNGRASLVSEDVQTLSPLPLRDNDEEWENSEANVVLGLHELLCSKLWWLQWWSCSNLDSGIWCLDAWLQSTLYRCCSFSGRVRSMARDLCLWTKKCVPACFLVSFYVSTVSGGCFGCVVGTLMRSYVLMNTWEPKLGRKHRWNNLETV